MKEVFIIWKLDSCWFNIWLFSSQILLFFLSILHRRKTNFYKVNWRR